MLAKEDDSWTKDKQIVLLGGEAMLRIEVFFKDDLVASEDRRGQKVIEALQKCGAFRWSQVDALSTWLPAQVRAGFGRAVDGSPYRGSIIVAYIDVRILVTSDGSNVETLVQLDCGKLFSLPAMQISRLFRLGFRVQGLRFTRVSALGSSGLGTQGNLKAAVRRCDFSTNQNAALDIHLR